MIPPKYLTIFWFEFERFPEPTQLNFGCGVTGFDYDDALLLLQTRVFTDREMPPILSSIENISLTNLEQSHVAPNIGNVVERGIWFPNRYPAPIH